MQPYPLVPLFDTKWHPMEEKLLTSFHCWTTVLTFDLIPVCLRILLNRFYVYRVKSDVLDSIRDMFSLLFGQHACARFPEKEKDDQFPVFRRSHSYTALVTLGYDTW